MIEDDPDIESTRASLYAFGCFLVVLAIVAIIAVVAIVIGISWATRAPAFQLVRMGMLQ
jgi:lipopolysaccharide export LptBFGC system permease protein LptF